MKYIFTVYTTDGNEWQSPEQEGDSTSAEGIVDLVTDLKNLKYFSMPIVDALGRGSHIYFHPEKIVAIKITEVTL